MSTTYIDIVQSECVYNERNYYADRIWLHIKITTTNKTSEERIEQGSYLYKWFIAANKVFRILAHNYYSS